VEMCSGIGTCHNKMDGTMCPSYRATLDEQNSTRGRANALRLAMTGQLGPDAMTSRRLFEILELCLSCKSCKSECPSNVDLTRLKSEFLQKYHDAHGTGLRERIVANSTLMAKMIAGPIAPLVNFFQKTHLFRKTLEIVAGFDSRRTPPEYARIPLAKWFKNRIKPNGRLTKKVVLFDDTYMSYHQTDVGISAVELLESCGYEVILANAGCCQRPKISHGFLRQAKTAGEKTLRNLDKYIQQGLKIAVCEPGCCSALTDDLPDLIDDEKLAQRIKENVMMIDEFLAGEIENGSLDCEFTSQFSKILIHGHCHQKSLYGTTSMKNLLDKVQGLSVKEIDSGCCGMAGSFGYEKEHYDLSMQIGEQHLFPAVRTREEGTAIIACGFSCRHQIADGTGVKALHWVQTIKGTVEKNKI
jgi:Fe-S oxidoreductase